MSSLSQNIQKGKILIAEPSILSDKSFNRSIILLTEHNEEGAVGFILNKPTEFLLKDLVFELDCDFRIYSGGPVEKDNLYFIHRLPQLIPQSIAIADGLFWGGNYEAIKTYLEQDLIKEDEIRFFLGYSGWTNEQLIAEIKEKTWTLTDNTFSDIFKINDAEDWQEKLLKMGGKYRIWANSPKDPSLN